MSEYIILRDTREKQGWDFPRDNLCLGVEDVALKTGDYTMKGYENVICIERKKEVSEIAGNIGKYKKRFEAELQRLTAFRYSYIICEFSLQDIIDYPKFSHIPQKRRQNIVITGKYVLKCLIEYQLKYGVHVMFCENPENAAHFARSLMKRIHEMLEKENDLNRK
jgi:ERCC4-type nuclease